MNTDDRIAQLEQENQALARANVKLNARLHDLEWGDRQLPTTRRSYLGQANPALSPAGKVYQQAVQRPPDVAKSVPGKQYRESV